jgi:hypothetical protein
VSDYDVFWDYISSSLSGRDFDWFMYVDCHPSDHPDV